MQFLKKGQCRKRKMQTLGLILVIVIVYFFLQFFSLSRLGRAVHGGKRLHFKAASNVVNSDVEVSDGEGEAQGKPGVESVDSDLAGSHQQELKVDIVSLPPGVHSSDAALYAKNSSGLFKCLKSKLHIPADRVNDDFCDCPDSSDEPGTSACPNGRFYCTVQLPHRDAQCVHSSKVNDGICDCCDGSDEWKDRRVPSPMQLHGKIGAVFHTPCNNRCEDVLKLLENEEEIRRKGIILQKRYLDAARIMTARLRPKYGPSGVFFLLSKQCYEHSAHEYLYTVCPFEDVKQSRGMATKTVLGRQGHWIQQKPGDYVLLMGGGDESLCPDGKPRETQIRFLCGLEDRVISISEDQKCHYHVRFSTPAAC